MRYDLIDLRLFLNIGLTNNLTKAAEKSFLSLSAASSRVKNLEVTLNAQLLTREASGVKMTHAGEILYEYAQEVFNDLDVMHAKLMPYSSEIKGKLRCLFNIPSTHSYIIHGLSTFLKKNSEIDIEIEEKTSSETIKSLKSGRADLGIVSTDVDLSGLESKFLFKDEFVLLVYDNHELANEKALNFVDVVEKYPFVGIRAESTLNIYVNKQLSSFGKRLQQRVYVNSFGAVVRLVQAEVGIAIIPKECIRTFIDKTNLREIPLLDTWAFRNRYLCRLKGRELPAFSEDFIDVLLKTAEGYSNN